MRINWLLGFIPIVIALHWFHASPTLVCLASALAIVPLAKLMGDATESIARNLGPTAGALLTASLANAPEIIISAFALYAGLIGMVKASLTGAILGNLLLGLGLSFFAGGIKQRRNQQFDPRAARTTTALLTLASFGLIVPAVAHFSDSASRTISRESAFVLFLIYLGSLVAIFWKREPLIGKEGVKVRLKEQSERPDEVGDAPAHLWSRNRALAILAGVTVGLAIMSEVLAGAIAPASESLHLSPRFSGIFLLALVGNAAELLNAVRFARNDQMDLVLGVTAGASAQVALFVAPVLVFLGLLMGREMDLVFSQLELVAIVMAIYLVRNLTYDGESNWLEGLMLIGVYVLFGLAFLEEPTPDKQTQGLAPPLSLSGNRP